MFFGEDKMIVGYLYPAGFAICEECATEEDKKKCEPIYEGESSGYYCDECNKLI